ncbi:MAG: recombinase family protein [Hyphomicrobiaceae bacterium]
MAKARIPAIAYLRTSSAANVCAGDSDTRQRQAIAGYAKRAGFELVGEFYDAAVSGKDPIEAGQDSKHSSSGWWATACASSSSRLPAGLPGTC